MKILSIKIVSLIILVPIFLLCMFFIHNSIKNRSPEKDRSTPEHQGISQKQRHRQLKEEYMHKENKRIARLREADTMKMSIEEVTSALNKQCDADTKIMLIGNLNGNYSTEALQLLNKLLDDESPEVRLEAMDMIASFESQKILPSIAKALKDKNEDVRLSAVNAIGDLDAGALIATAMDDKSENVRDAAFDIIEESSNETKLNICEYGIHSPFPDVQERTVSLISDITSRRTVDILIDGLRLDNKELRESIKSEIEYCIGKDFKNYSQAAAWWKKNRARYTDDLDEIDDDSEVETP